MSKLCFLRRMLFFHPSTKGKSVHSQKISADASWQIKMLQTLPKNILSVVAKGLLFVVVNGLHLSVTSDYFYIQ